MNQPIAMQSVIAGLADWWRERRDIATQLNEIATLSPGDLAAAAADCGVTTADLIAVVRSGPHGADEMQQLLAALNIDPAAVRADRPGILREMAVNCAECGSKARCRRDLADGIAAAHYGDYCVNAETMNELRAEPEMLHG
jgi:hypothetical protein